ncbi:Arc family DNA-binding protein [Pseudaminobacter salicylatoxidans]|uniref:Arc family DNA-binding protein n=1 Tax=Pseudaminobacter salicylatoxidans TaxID=93369 RepID=UPI000370B6CE
MSKSDHPSFHLRLPPHLLKQVKLPSVEIERSITAEILARLERTFADDDADRREAVKLLTDAISLLDKGGRG